MAAERLNAPIASCIMVDDSLHVLEVAKGAGMQTLGVYDAFSEKDIDKIKELADGYIADFSEIE
jgi:beta-phosphoglucomutase-like phosphatase (HAD superfamily)